MRTAFSEQLNLNSIFNCFLLAEVCFDYWGVLPFFLIFNFFLFFKKQLWSITMLCFGAFKAELMQKVTEYRCVGAVVFILHCI